MSSMLVNNRAPRSGAIIKLLSICRQDVYQLRMGSPVGIGRRKGLLVGTVGGDSFRWMPLIVSVRHLNFGVYC
jgi:hypothetical protein